MPTDPDERGLFTGCVGAVSHASSHIVDKDLGGRASDPWALSGVALIQLVGAALRLRAKPRNEVEGGKPSACRTEVRG
ncbi:hypothetical protein [Nonomuraea sp. B19D2]|uniref:hypothetical protein n=1 Tax=Nonomuraea sp. B19D2 TaxID=3159561 RepID=UPI0032DAD529